MDNRTSKPLDRRQIRTRDAIHTALMALMSEKPLEAITVSELALRAGVNRKTFYNHYTSIQDVRRELDQQYIDMVFSFTEGEPLDALPHDPSPFMRSLIQAMVKQPVRAKLLFESGEHMYLAARLKEQFLPYMERMAISHGARPEYVSYLLEYVVNGIMSLLNLWVHDPDRMSVEDFVRLTSALVRSCAVVGETLYK